MLRLVKQLISFVFGLIETLLIFRFILKLLGADPAAPVVAWIYDVTAPLLKPFLFAFPTSTVRGGYSLEFTTLFAIFAYAFVAYLIVEFIDLIDNSRTKKQ